MSRRSACFCLFCMFFFLSPSVYSQNRNVDLEPVLFSAAGIGHEDIDAVTAKRAVTLFDLYALSVAETERMAIEGENSVQAKAHRDQAFGGFLPQINFSASKTYPTPSSTDTFMPKSTVAFYAQQNILAGLKDISQYRKAGSEMKMREYTLRNTAGQLLLDVTSAYMNVVRITKSLRNREKILENYRSISAELEKRVAIGRSRPSELLQIRSQIYSLLAQIESLKNNFSQAKSTLATLTGMSLSAALDDPFPVPAPSFGADDPARLTAGRYDIKAAEAQLNMTKDNLLLAWGGFAPDVYAAAGERLYQRNMTGRDYYVSLNATMPLFSGGTTVAAVAEAKSLVRQSELALSQTRRNAVQQISDAMTNYKSTQHQIDSYKKALDEADANYRTILDEYRLRLVTILDVFTAITSLENARDSYEGVVIDNQLSRITLGVATGEMIGPGVDILRSASRSAAKGDVK